jgi:hypothetical protein
MIYSSFIIKCFSQHHFPYNLRPIFRPTLRDIIPDPRLRQDKIILIQYIVTTPVEMSGVLSVPEIANVILRNFHSCTVQHLDTIKVFYLPTDA